MMFFERMAPLHSTKMMKKLMWGWGSDLVIDDESDELESGWVGLGVMTSDFG